MGCRADEEGADRPVLWLLLGVSLLVYAVTFRYNLLMRGPHARYLFPALGPMAVLFAAGLVWLGGRLYDQYGTYDVVWWLGVALGLFAAVMHWPIRESRAPAFTVPEAAKA